jgi:hypothetical protein
VLSAILRQFLWPVAPGLLAGVAAALALAQVLRQLLFRISSLDRLSYSGGHGVLITIAMIAAMLPARRALRRRGLVTAGRSALTNPVGLETGRPH